MNDFARAVVVVALLIPSYSNAQTLRQSMLEVNSEKDKLIGIAEEFNRLGRSRTSDPLLTALYGNARALRASAGLSALAAVSFLDVAAIRELSTSQQDRLRMAQFIRLRFSDYASQVRTSRQGADDMLEFLSDTATDPALGPASDSPAKTNAQLIAICRRYRTQLDHLDEAMKRALAMIVP